MGFGTGLTFQLLGLRIDKKRCMLTFLEADGAVFINWYGRGQFPFCDRVLD